MHSSPSIAIMGTGFVGGALQRWFESEGASVALYDPPKGLNDAAALAQAEIIFVCVPTPFYLDGSGFDDSFLRAALDAIPQDGKVVVLKSTILPGTTDRLQQEYPGHHFLFNPEFLTEATADHDLRFPTRQILGYTGPESLEAAPKVMAILPDAPFKKIVPAKAAEMVKYFGNTFYALKVAFSNQAFDLCQALGIEYDLVKECVETEPMIGPSHLTIFHKGYRGYGGKCLPKDTRSLIQLGQSCGVDLTLLRAAEAYNNDLTARQGLDVAWKEGSPVKEGGGTAFAAAEGA